MIKYEMPWRPNYEIVLMVMWLTFAATALIAVPWTPLPPFPYRVMACFSAIMGGLRGFQGVCLYRRKRRLARRNFTFIDRRTLYRRMKKDKVWLGDGFEWGQDLGQLMYEILKLDEAHIFRAPPDRNMGASWIHGLGPKEKPLYTPLKHLAGHTLVLGTTGAGKTRLFDLLVSQAIQRGESVIIIDPKGDKDLRLNAQAACVAAGGGERFVWFHPAFPDDSVCINPLANFERLSGVASRIAALIPSETGADPFKAFGQMALNTIIQGISIQGAPPTLVRIKSFLEGGIDSLVETSVTHFAHAVMPVHWERDLGTYLAKAKKTVSRLDEEAQRTWAFMQYYWKAIAPVRSSPDIEGILTMAAHNREHLGKMLASLNPILHMLTSGPMGDLLSPPLDDPRPTTNLVSVINNGQVLYVGLDSLSDTMVGSAIGSMILADLAAVAGARYNFGKNLRPINVFIDEAAEVINDPAIQLLNKGRGSLLRLIVATQTIADLSVRTGSQDKALQVLGNINNTLCLRVTDSKTQKYVADGIPKTRFRYIVRSQGSNNAGQLDFGGTSGERLMEEEGDLIPPAVLGKLPDLEYVAKLSGGRIVKGRLPILQGSGA